MNRQEQKELLTSSVIWTEESITHFKASFLAHYRILNRMIDDAVKCIEEDLPRVAYFLYTEYMYSFYSEMCIAIECMIKSLLEENNYSSEQIKSFGHRLDKLLCELPKIDDIKTEKIYKTLDNHKLFLNKLTANKIFNCARYFEMDPENLKSDLNQFWALLMDIDIITKDCFEEGDLINTVYPDSMIS